MFKRSLERLILHLQETYSPLSPLPAQPSQKDNNPPLDDESDSDVDNDKDEETKQEILLKTLKADGIFTALLHRLQTAIIPNSHRAFTHLITSTQYAGMGMVMLACLAKVADVLELLFEDEDNNETVAAVIEATGRTAPAITSYYSSEITGKTDNTMSFGHEGREAEEGDEDIGEIINRDSVDILHQRVRKADVVVEKAPAVKRPKLDAQDEKILNSSREEKIVSKSSKAPKKTKAKLLEKITSNTSATTEYEKPRKRTAIDDLFEGL
ncbi:hypothetical protein ABW20_dc0107030 [Dactylellina cionopaga]|nr:hypothetical protein ABW20_dc0107030 [Dactylellina cionopaga]